MSAEPVTEAQAMEAFDAAIDPRYFEVLREVGGWYMAFRAGVRERRPRIDRILVPTAELRALGWTEVIAVEGKRPGVKLGPAISQAIDYTWAIFERGGRHFKPSAIFVWPVDETIRGPVESVMLQNRVGHCEIREGNDVSFFFGQARMLRLIGDSVSANFDLFMRTGRTVGSR